MQRWGETGPPVLLVHGSVTSGEMTWSEQRPLAERWTLFVVDRRGFYPNQPVERVDFDVDADDVAELLGTGMHLVGHSYGGVVSLLAAAKRPEAVRSLTVIEPPCFAVAPDDPEVRSFELRRRDYWEHGPRDPEAFLRGFLKLAGSAPLPLNPLPPALLQNTRLLMSERDPAEAVIPLDVLRQAPFPKLVVSGDHAPMYERVCDALEKGLGAERAVIRGARHSVQRTGAPFNDRLETFLLAAEAQRANR